MNTVHRATLVLSGLLAFVIGAAVLFAPVTFHASMNGLAVGGDVDQLSEIRAPGAALFVFGGLIAAGGVHAAWRHVATVSAAILFTSYGLGRVVGIAVDGLPSAGLVSAGVVELLVGLVAAAFLLAGSTGKAR
ncbi:MAG: DUF4345 domain-containing protein [Myxococcales bacterium]|nr:DUF4345 domain-containing protein [Myxococcales bacterium]